MFMHFYLGGSSLWEFDVWLIKGNAGIRFCWHSSIRFSPKWKQTLWIKPCLRLHGKHQWPICWTHAKPYTKKMIYTAKMSYGGLVVQVFTHSSVISGSPSNSLCLPAMIVDLIVTPKVDKRQKALWNSKQITCQKQIAFSTLASMRTRVLGPRSPHPPNG